MKGPGAGTSRRRAKGKHQLGRNSVIAYVYHKTVDDHSGALRPHGSWALLRNTHIIHKSCAVRAKLRLY